MKKGYLELNLLLLFIYVSLHIQMTMSKHPHHHHLQQSRECHKCPPGFGVARPCSRGRDTECGACAPDHYSAHRSAWRPCYPCSRCGAGLYVAHPCTAHRDTVCDSCHTYRGPHNEDFYQRCVRPNDTQRLNSQAKESQSVTSLGLSAGVPTSVVVASSVLVAALVVILAAACFVTTRCTICKRGDKRYPYIAVSTKEAVML